jgi:hypothetical protein
MVSGKRYTPDKPEYFVSFFPFSDLRPNCNDRASELDTKDFRTSRRWRIPPFPLRNIHPVQAKRAGL